MQWCINLMRSLLPLAFKVKRSKQTSGNSCEVIWVADNDARESNRRVICACVWRGRLGWSSDFNLIAGLVEDRLVELAVNRGRRFRPVSEFPGRSGSTCPPHGGTNLSSCSARKLLARVRKSTCGFGGSCRCFCSVLAENDIVTSLDVDKAHTGKCPQSS